jgi:guanylate kinase
MGPPPTGRQPDRGLLVVISGPSGVGKTTIARAVQERFDALFSVSATTRPRSDQEEDGVDYHFVDEDEFRSMIKNGELLESAQVFGRHRYGTPRRPVEEAIRAGRIVILDIDVQGALQVRRAMPEAFMLFVLPPGDDELLRRLRGRRRDDEAAIRRRFEAARREIALARSSGAYDAFLVNDDLQTAKDEASRLVESRRLHPPSRA